MLPNDNTPNVVDAGAVTLWLATIVNVLPSIAAILSIIWFAIRILESETVQKMLGINWRWIKQQETKNDVTKD